MLYLEAKWSASIPFAKTSDLLKEVCPSVAADPDQSLA
jgi:hypothetical protein